MPMRPSSGKKFISSTKQLALLGPTQATDTRVLTHNGGALTLEVNRLEFEANHSSYEAPRK
jgi:hypothetical protein